MAPWQSPLYSTPFRLLRLPEEIIILILEMLPEPPTIFDFVPVEVRLAEHLYPGQVCSDLRRIWLSTPRCWTTLQVLLGTPLTISAGHIQLLTLFLERSSQCLLDLNVQMVPRPLRDPPSLTQPIQNLLHASFPRCRSIALNVEADWSLAVTLDRNLAPLSHLTKLELVITSPMSPSQIWQPSLLLASCDPAILRSLRIEYPGPARILPPEGSNLWTGLRELRLGGSIKTASWGLFLQRCPNLEHVFWGSYRPSCRGAESDWDMLLPSLKTLRVNRHTPNLDKFYAPKLVEMCIRGVEEAFALFPSLVTNIGDPNSLPQARFPSLRRLILPGFETISRVPTEFPLLFRALCSNVEELVFFPRESDSPLLEVMDALCDMQEQLMGEKKDEGCGAGEGSDGLKLSSLLVEYYAIGREPCHCGHEPLIDESTRRTIGGTVSAHPNPAEIEDVTRSFRRFLDLFPEARLAICSCCWSPAGLESFLHSLSYSQYARVKVRSFDSTMRHLSGRPHDWSR